MPGFGPKIFIGSADRSLRKRLKQILLRQGYTVVGEENDGPASLRVIRRVMPDLVILDWDLPGMSGLELAKIIEEDRIAPVLLLTPTWEKELFEMAKDSWVFAFLVKPIQEGHLLSTASFVINTYAKMKELENQVNELKETLETRKLVEKAKGIIMKRLNVSETDAYKLMQKKSMDKSIPMKQVAKIILAISQK
ncbi:MAG: ANTAR domain-containing protein [Desulfitobacteriaceae bacterium]|nr:ANTAR domain-containing protein [Desulfitobacteriaceae bacterium]MDD4752275.1 ANTAR domain-containing protein [Desulfitobacteriaceae bacterium]